MPQILLIDDDDDLRNLQARVLQSEGYVIFQAGDLKVGWIILKKEDIQLVLCDVRLPDGDGISFVSEFKTKYPLKEIILFTGRGTISDGVRAIKNGAFDYLTKGDDNIKVISFAEKAVQKAILQQKVHTLESKLDKRYGFDSIIGVSPAVIHAKNLALKVANTDASVLLLGETGTGKEIFAQAIHYSSHRKDQNFVAVNCSALGKELLESELFGYKAGAFTGANTEKKGLFEEADRGTILLDEIGEMTIDLQVKLLRVLENGSFIKVGDTKTTNIDCRIIAATNRDLEKSIENGLFRADLYYRLSAFVIELPPLRERHGDIDLIADFYIKKLSLKLNMPVPLVDPQYLEKLRNYTWKGNIRELKNAIERSLILSSEILTPDLLLFDFQFSNVDDSLSSAEKRHILKVLTYTKGNKTQAAQILNIAIATLYRKMEQYGL